MANSSISIPYQSGSLNAYSQLTNIETAIHAIESEIFLRMSSLIAGLFTPSKAEKFTSAVSFEYRMSDEFHQQYKKLLNEGMEERVQNLLELEIFRSMKKNLWGDKIFWENEINEIEEFKKEDEIYNKESPIGL